MPIETMSSTRLMPASRILVDAAPSVAPAGSSLHRDSHHGGGDVALGPRVKLTVYVNVHVAGVFPPVHVGPLKVNNPRRR